MTSPIPDSISTDELLRLQVNAQADSVPDEEAVIDHTPLIVERVNDLVKEINCPTAWLGIAEYCVWQSAQFHQHRTNESLDNKDADQALAWGADHQSLILILAILKSID